LLRLKVTTVNNVYVVEQDDAGDHRCISTTNSKYEFQVVNRPCSRPEVGHQLKIDRSHLDRYMLWTSTILKVEEGDGETVHGLRQDQVLLDARGS